MKFLRPILYLVLACVLCVIAWCILKPKPQAQIYLSPPPSQTAWVRPRPSVWPSCLPADIKHHGKPLRVECFGDSITFGNGNQTTAMGGYREALRRMVIRPIVFVGHQRCGYPAVMMCEGYPGWSLGELQSIAQICAYRDKPDVVLFMAGVNDFNPAHHESANEALQYEREAILNIASGAPSARIFVACPIPLRRNHVRLDGDPAQLTARLPSLMRVLQVEGVHCQYVDMSNLQLKPNEYDSIGIHPLDSGCVKEARIWAHVL